MPYLHCPVPLAETGDGGDGHVQAKDGEEGKCRKDYPQTRLRRQGFQFSTQFLLEIGGVLFNQPGTGDVPLTVFQSIPVDGIIIVTSPQELVSMIVEKAVKMAKMMNIHIYGIVENMSYYQCPDCGKKHSIFGESNIDKVAEKFGISRVAKLPIDSSIAKHCDAGDIEGLEFDWLDDFVKEM